MREDEVLSPELKLAIVTLIKEQSNQQLIDEVRNQVAVELGLHDAKYSKFSKVAIENKMASFSEQHLNDRLNQMVESVIGECQTSVKNTMQMVDDLRKGTFPVSYVSLINTMNNRLTELEAQFKGFKAGFDNFIAKRVLEQISNDDITQLYRESGANVLEVAAQFGVSHSTAHEYVQGKTPNVETRNRLQAFLMEKAKKRRD